MRHTHPIAVIGHVDHGKSTLVHALTGTETDRLAEEKERGLSIVLGFANLETSVGVLDFIDAPGHEDFVRTMISGTAGARVALLVVSLVDGFEAQTHEHLRIARLLGLTHFVVAATKADRVTGGDRAERLADLRHELEQVGLATAPMVACSAQTGEGLDKLHSALVRVVSDDTAPTDDHPAFLPVDRVFSAKGAGTVVTGTLKRGTLRSGETVEVLPRGSNATIRGLQVHGKAEDVAQAGQRVAVNLRGASVADIRPGGALTRPGAYQATTRLDGDVTMAAPKHSAPLRHMEQVRVLFGTTAVSAELRLIDSGELAPGDRGLVQLRLKSPVVAHGGQRAIIRRLSPSETVAGLDILDPAPPPARRNETKTIAVLNAIRDRHPEPLAIALAVRDRQPVRHARISALLGQAESSLSFSSAMTELPEGLVPRDMMEAAKSAIIRAVSRFHENQPLRAAIPTGQAIRPAVGEVGVEIASSALDRLTQEDTLVTHGAGVALVNFDPFATLPPETRADLDRLESALRAGGVSPPTYKDLCALSDQADDLLRLLEQSGQVVSLRNTSLQLVIHFHRQALDDAETALRQAFPFPAEFRAGEARAVLGTSRKFVVPVLEYLDRHKRLVRRGELRLFPPPAA